MKIPVMFSAWLLVAGCSQPTAPTPDATVGSQVIPESAPVTLPEQSEPVLNEPVAETAKPATAAAPELKIETLDWDQTLAIVAAHPGQVVVLDLWATYCPPCLKELPGLVALQDKYPDKVHCVSVCLDFDGDPAVPPSKLEPDIRQVLEKFKAQKTQNVLLSIGSEELLKRVDQGSMPLVYVYDQTGKQVHLFPDRSKMDEATYEQHITPAVEALLNSAEPSK